MTTPGTVPRALGYLSLAVALWFLVSWPVGLLLDPERLSRPSELEYLLGDWLVALPLAVAAAATLLRSRPAGPLLFLLMEGAVAYSAVHFTVHLICSETGTLTRLGLGLGLAALLGILVLVARPVFRALAPEPPAPNG